MEKNVGGLDRSVRLVVGPVLVVTALQSMLGKRKLGSALTAGAFAVGAMLTVSGLTRACPANAAMGRDTSQSSDGLSEEARQIRERAQAGR